MVGQSVDRIRPQARLPHGTGERHFEALIESPEREVEGEECSGQWADIWLGLREEVEAQGWLGEQGYGEPALILKQLDTLRRSRKASHKATSMSAGS